MPVDLSPDRQPLVPPAWKRMNNDHNLGGHMDTVTARSLRSDYLTDADTSQCLRSVSMTSSVGTCSSSDFFCPDENAESHPVSRRVLLHQRTSTPMKNERQARSTVMGLISQFSQLHNRRPLFGRLTFAMENLFGRMCSRRRRMTSSPELEEDWIESQGDIAEGPRDTIHSHTKDAGGANTTFPLIEDDFLQQTHLEKSLEDSHRDKMAAESPLDRTYLDINFDIELESGDESEEMGVENDERDKKKSDDFFFDGTHNPVGNRDVRTSSSPPYSTLSLSPSRRPRKRLTFLSPLNLIHLPQPHLSKLQRKLDDDADTGANMHLEDCKDAMAQLDFEKTPPSVNADSDIRFIRRMSKSVTVELSDSVCSLAGSSGAGSLTL